MIDCNLPEPIAKGNMASYMTDIVSKLIYTKQRIFSLWHTIRLRISLPRGVRFKFATQISRKFGFSPDSLMAQKAV